jgi:Na+-driven multidrug efflux pump
MVALSSDFLRIAAAGYLVMGIGALMGQCISGSGDTLPPMLITLGMWTLQIPLALFLPDVTGLGVYGVRWAMVIGSGAGALAFLVYFRTGRWKRKRV